MFEMCLTDQQRAKVPFESIAAPLTELYISLLLPPLPVLEDYETSSSFQSYSNMQKQIAYWDREE